MEGELKCNFKKCRKGLNAIAYVTSCSHIFCDEDGTREFAKILQCPACETSLPNKHDILRIDLHPPEQYKSMVLAGQKPDTVVEVMSRAISFWTYQTDIERSHLERMAAQAKEKAEKLEGWYEKIVARQQAEIEALKVQLTNAKKEIESLKKKYHELAEVNMEKSRQITKLQGLFESTRRKNVYLAQSDAAEALKPPGRVSAPPSITQEGLGDADRTVVLRTPFDHSGKKVTPVIPGVVGGMNAVQRHFTMDLSTPQKLAQNKHGRPPY
ncbi:E3 ubiquitin-protein ligase CCNB1IP1 isoform X2 [Lingula anatina]|uniref:E3 ubiquitin-protein ligase CCNB1IP1 isoform X2 n=1 Tax=Lingula anatina TaxID=7574 RepID=A0A2R2MKF9_LINAN|nr:E3 ubiquitin-protein ligase CCNB1IP1 isoform X2 [Lingula anatina]|eukprot:XP_023930701.1 E3 ubiquitin-protein ligase CCNB1IP1 isoform X2 [Lingula anatina]